MAYSETEAYLEEIQDGILELVKQIKETNYLLRLLVSNSYENMCKEAEDEK